MAYIIRSCFPNFPDTNAPNVTILEPFPKKTTVPVLTVRWTSDEEAKYYCAVDDVTRPVLCGYGKEGQWTTPTMPDGEHTFFLIPEDKLGNKAPSLSRKWSIGMLVIYACVYNT